ncbi:MAG: AsmA family protein, partial [Pseudomonadota bacterium]
MNWLFNTIGILIITVLLAALVGPYFIDWTAYRHAFENQGERLLGHRVKVLGTADARLFPVPSLTFSDVRIGEPDAPLMTVSRFEVDIELTPLLKGEVRVLDMRLDSPDVDLTLDRDGRLSWFAGRGAEGAMLDVDPDALSIDTLSVENGRFRLDDEASGRSYRLDSVNLALETRSLLGPYKIDGSALVDETSVSLQVGTGVFRPGEGLQVKVRAVPADAPVSVATDGRVSVTDGRLLYEGVLTAERVVEEGTDVLPVSANAQFSLDPDSFVADNLEIAVGPADRPLRLQGTMALSYGDVPRFSADLTATQIDLDRILGAGPAEPVQVADAFSLLPALIAAAPVPDLPGRLSLKVPVIVVAGGLVETVELNAATRARGWVIESLSATLPGRTGLAADGVFETAPEPVYSGRVLLKAPQPLLLIDWLDPDAGSLGRLEPFELDTNVHARADSFEVDTFLVRLGEAEISGAATWFSNGADKPASLSVTAATDRLDLDRYLDGGLGAVSGRYAVPLAGLDSLIKLTAGTLTIAGVEIRGADINAAFADGTLIVDRFFVEDLGGAELDASGTVENVLSVPNGSFDLSMFATDVTGLIRVADAFVPDNPVINSLFNRRNALAPLALTGRLEARAEGDGTSAVLTLDGDLGRTVLSKTANFKGRVDGWQDAAVEMSVKAENRDGAQLLRQLGFEVLPVAAADNGALALDFAGTASGGLRGTASLSTGLAVADYDGTLVLTDSDGVSIDGTARLRTDDLASSLLLVGRMVPILAGRIPVSVEA